MTAHTTQDLTRLPLDPSIWGGEACAHIVEHLSLVDLVWRSAGVHPVISYSLLAVAAAITMVGMVRFGDQRGWAPRAQVQGNAAVIAGFALVALMVQVFPLQPATYQHCQDDPTWDAPQSSLTV